VESHLKCIWWDREVKRVDLKLAVAVKYHLGWWDFVEFHDLSNFD
jgi:hypothetical protein